MSGSPDLGAMKAIVVGCARDVADGAPAMLANLERIEGLFDAVAWAFVENDSRDDTKALLRGWGASRANFRLITLDGLSRVAERTRRLATARNAYVACARAAGWLDTHDLVLALDLDGIAQRPLSLPALREAIGFLMAEPDRAGVFANQIGPYYDLWALRHCERCPGDVWEEVFDCVQQHGVTDEEALAMTLGRRVFEIDPGEAPIEVESAFGGLGIYRTEFIRRSAVPYVGEKVKVARMGGQPVLLGWQTCEHVSFHAGLRAAGGRLFIHPGLVNGVTQGLSFPASAWRSFLFSPVAAA